MRIALFVGTRADLGPLVPVIEALEAHRDVELHLVAGVAYGRGDLHQRLSTSLATPPAFDRVHQLTDPIVSLDQASLAAHGTELSAGMTALLQRLDPHVLVVLGDRWELLYVVPPAFLGGVRVVHLHGGEVTEGALDERVRHAITKLSDQHCVASEDAARRLRQLGEPAERIHVTGAPGLDLYAGVSPIGDETFRELFGRELVRPMALFTYHPPTAEGEEPVGRWAREALEACLDHCNTVIATHPGLDVGRDEILAQLEQLASDARVILVDALGPSYPGVLAAADVVVGNSSSGVIEAASVGVAAVDVGERQRGRLRGANVRHAREGRAAVSAEVAAALSPDFRALARGVSNPYGDGDAAGQVVQVVINSHDTGRTKIFNEGGAA